MTNIGPILDMSVVDLDKQGRDVVRQVVITFALLIIIEHFLSSSFSLPPSLPPPLS